MPCIEVKDKDNSFERKMFCISDNMLTLGGKSIPTSEIKAVQSEGNIIHVTLTDEFKSTRGMDDLHLSVPEGNAVEFAKDIVRRKGGKSTLEDIF